MADLLKPLGLSRNQPSEPKASVLLVDDNPANLLALRAILKTSAMTSWKLVPARRPYSG